MIGTISLPDAQALRETDLDPSLDPWAEIERLKRQKNAIILAHYYQDGEIQDLANFVDDFLDLSRRAAATDADMIVFSLEETCLPDDFARCRAAHPDHIALTYINCSAEVKALSGIIVTSSNAEYIIIRLPEHQPILFAPDKHLGAYLARKTGREMVLWDGTCIVHDRFSVRELVKLKTRHPDALIAAHPECHQGILDHADHVGSTRSILDFVLAAPEREFIIATERHIIHQMEKAAPEKTFIAAPGSDGSCNCADCPFMELNTLEKMYLAMVNDAPRIEISEDLRLRALKPLEKMLEMSPPARSVPQAAE